MKAPPIEGPISVGDFLRRRSTGSIYEIVGETGHGTKYLGDEYQNVHMHMRCISGKGRSTSKWRAAVRNEFERCEKPT